MERLTNRKTESPSLTAENQSYWANVELKLAAYEDAEEQGRLVVLPCKVGDTVWRLEYANGDFDMPEPGIGEYKLDLLFYAMERDNFGEIVFLTREEAEAALKEMGVDDGTD